LYKKLPEGLKILIFQGWGSRSDGNHWYEGRNTTTEKTVLL